MAIPISIDKLLEQNIVEWARIEFKEGFNPEAILKTISAFANDIDNWGGGYIVIGVKDQDGRIVHPVKGVNEKDLDKIQKELLKYCEYLRPIYIPQVEIVEYENKKLVLIWCPGGYERPYACPKVPTNKKSEKIYYIRKLSSTVEAKSSDLKELIELSNNIPFDDRINPKGELDDLDIGRIEQYLKIINSDMLSFVREKDIKEISRDLRIADGPKEYFKPLNVGLLFFNRRPEFFFPYSRIEVISIPDPTGIEMNEQIFYGPINEQLVNALDYIRQRAITKKTIKTGGIPHAMDVYNYSFNAISEFLSNAVYHKSYQIHEPITVRIELDKIEIISMPGPDRSISDESIKKLQMISKKYRNRRIGDFLREFHLVEGKNTGIPKALRAIENNGSPLPIFDTDDERSYFSVTLPIHEAFIKIRESGNRKTKTKKSRDEIKNYIIDMLDEESMSTSELYRRLGYSGNFSSTFRECVGDLVRDHEISYSCDCINDSSNVLIKNKTKKKKKQINK